MRSADITVGVGLAVGIDRRGALLVVLGLGARPACPLLGFLGLGKPLTRRLALVLGVVAAGAGLHPCELSSLLLLAAPTGEQNHGEHDKRNDDDGDYQSCIHADLPDRYQGPDYPFPGLKYPSAGRLDD
jgi:hypothetical protein